MKNIIIKVALSILLVSLFSCAIKINFTEQELEWFNVYEKDDVLVFENLKTKRIDTPASARL